MAARAGGAAGSGGWRGRVALRIQIAFVAPGTSDREEKTRAKTIAASLEPPVCELRVRTKSPARRTLHVGWGRGSLPGE